jgi:phosphopantothenoylcysteine decarboxylase/phosphopantothenate--cysteine ligase
VRNPDILAGLVAERGDASTPVIVGFAAETGETGAHGGGIGRREARAQGL